LRIELLYAHARMSKVTLINLPFIEVVFSYISSRRLPARQCVGGPSVGQRSTELSQSVRLVIA